MNQETHIPETSLEELEKVYEENREVINALLIASLAEIVLRKNNLISFEDLRKLILEEKKSDWSIGAVKSLVEEGKKENVLMIVGGDKVSVTKFGEEVVEAYKKAMEEVEKQLGGTLQ